MLLTILLAPKPNPFGLSSGSTTATALKDVKYINYNLKLCKNKKWNILR